MATLEEEIRKYLEGIAEVPDGNASPQNRKYPDEYPEVVYMRTGTRHTPTHDCDTLNDGLFRIEIFSDKHDEAVAIAKQIRDDLKAGTGAINFSGLKLHLPQGRSEFRQRESALPKTDQNEFGAAIEARIMT